MNKESQKIISDTLAQIAFKSGPFGLVAYKREMQKVMDYDRLSMPNDEFLMTQIFAEINRLTNIAINELTSIKTDEK